MSCCNNCSNNNCPDDKCLSSLTFRVDEGFLVPRLNGAPLEPIDLRELSAQSETNTHLQLDVIEGRLVYSSENSEKGISSPDMIPIEAIARLISLNELADVEYQVATDGDILSWNGDEWVSYTVPSGTVVTPVGVDADGRLVKQGSGGPMPTPGEIPVGGIMAWPALPNQIPAGWLECNGQAVSRSVYADLFNVLGTRYGGGDGSTSFNLPNISTRAIHGLSSTDTQFNVVGQTGGSKTHTMTVAQMPPHNHTMNSAGNHSHNISNRYIRDVGSGGNIAGNGGGSVWRNLSSVPMSSSGSHTHSINSRGGGNAMPILDPYITMPFIMRAV